MIFDSVQKVYIGNQEVTKVLLQNIELYTSVAPFIPTSITGLQLWLDGSDSSTLYDATVGGSLVAADGAVARWEDKSGTGRHATQSILNNRPLRKISQKNGLDGINFDGSNDTMSGSNITTSLPITIFTVVRCEEDQEIGGIFSHSGSTTVFYRFGGDDTLRIFCGSDLTGTLNAIPLNEWFIVGTVANGSNSSLYKNDTIIATGNAGTQSPVGNYSLALWPGGNQYQGLTMGEIVVYDKALSVQEITQITEYLNNKWVVY